MAMDLATRFILAFGTATSKINYDATNLLKAAKAKAGKPYLIPTTHGLSSYHTAFKKMLGVLKGLRMCDIHIRNEFANTNKQERINSTFAGRAGQARGINSENSLVYRWRGPHHLSYVDMAGLCRIWAESHAKRPSRVDLDWIFVA